MKELKVILIAVEIAALISVVSLAFCDSLGKEEEFFKSMFITLFSLLAVVMQKEQQSIDWNESEEDALINAEDVDL